MNWTETIIISAHEDTYKNTFCIVYIYIICKSTNFLFLIRQHALVDIVWDILCIIKMFYCSIQWYTQYFIFIVFFPHIIVLNDFRNILITQ